MARIAVIGAGMGAMAAAARLAVAGHRVTVYERSATYGGSVGRYRPRRLRLRHRVPALLHLPAVYRDLFVKTGKEPLEQLRHADAGRPGEPPCLRRRHRRVSLPNASRAGVVAALDGALGAGAGERWGEFLDRARDAWDRSRRPLLEEPLRADWQVLGRDPYPALRQRRLLRAARQAGTVAEVGAWELADPRLAALLDGYALSYGLDPRRAPASAALLPVHGADLRQLVRARRDAGAGATRCTSGAWRGRWSSCSAPRWPGSWRRTAGRPGSSWRRRRSPRPITWCCGAWPRPALVPGQGLWQDGDVTAQPRPADRATVPGRFPVLLALRGARPAGDGAPDRGARRGRRGRADAVFGGRLAERPTVTVLRPDDPSTRPDDAHEAVTRDGDGRPARRGGLDGRGAARAVRGRA